MIRLPDEEKSLWLSDVHKKIYPALNGRQKVDVVIVGGGICGLSTAYLLKQSGFRVAVLEKTRVASGTTGRTTGKVTSQHSLIYADLQDRVGKEYARLYGQANQSAIGKIEEIIKKEKIDCDWQRDDNYVYTSDAGQVSQFKKEAKTAVSLGLPASFETSSPLPFEIRAAVKFSGQAKFNAAKYAKGLARAVHGKGSYVFEDSNVSSIRDGSPARVATKDGLVEARCIVVATNVPTFPLMARGGYCILEYPTTSYLIAGRLKKKLSGMYISPDESHFSIMPFVKDKDKMLLIGGNDHIRGLGRPDNRYRQIADYAEKYFALEKIDYKWSAWDYIAYDYIPLVGKVYPWSKNLFIATAFKKWGLTGTTVAAMILHDQIFGRHNPWAKVFNSMRSGPIRSIPRVAASYIKQ